MSRLRVEFGWIQAEIHQNLEKWVDQLPVMVENLREDETPNDWSKRRCKVMGTGYCRFFKQFESNDFQKYRGAM